MIVAMVMPEIGFDEVPMRPVMRDETVTKKKPKTTTSRPMQSEPGKLPCGKFGATAMKSAEHERRRARPGPCRDRARCGSPRSGLAALPNAFTDSRNAETIVGSVRTSVIRPAHATAPAPM